MLLQPRSSQSPVWSEPLHIVIVWEESSQEGPLTDWTRLSIWAPRCLQPKGTQHPASAQSYTHTHTQDTLLSLACGTTREGMLFYPLFGVILEFEQGSKLKHKQCVSLPSLPTACLSSSCWPCSTPIPQTKPLHLVLFKNKWDKENRHAHTHSAWISLKLCCSSLSEAGHLVVDVWVL